MARPRSYDHDALRAATIRVARRLLEEGGPPALTARALAGAVGATPGTVYAVFGNLKAVLLEVNRETFLELAAVIDAVPDGPPADWLARLADAYVAFMLERRDVWRGLFEGPRETESFPPWYTELIDRLIERIAAPLAELGAGPRARDLAEQLFVSVHGAVALAAIGRLDMVTARPAQALAREAVETTVRAIGTGPA